MRLIIRRGTSQVLSSICTDRFWSCSLWTSFSFSPPWSKYVERRKSWAGFWRLETPHRKNTRTIESTRYSANLREILWIWLWHLFFFCRFFMYMKLFAVMNGVWMMEFASWITGYSDGIWYFFDICNCLRGLWLLIFCVLLSKRVRVGVRNSLSLQYSESKSSFNRNTTVVTSTSREKEQLEMNRIADGDESEMIATETNQTDPLSSTEN